MIGNHCKSCPCNGCKFDVCGIGSETCSAVIGDYCQMIDDYIYPTPDEWASYDLETKMFYVDLFHNLGL